MNNPKHLWALGLFIGLWFLFGFPCHLSAFSILEPKTATQAASGQMISVKVDLGNEIGIHAVKFYWYRQGEVPINAQQAEPQLVTTSASSPPFSGQLPVPEAAIGQLRLLAIGEISGGRLSGRTREEFDEILLHITPAAELNHIVFEAEQPWKLHTLGQVLDIPVVGQFSDGTSRSLGGAYAGSQYQSSNEQVVQTFSMGQFRVVGPGTAKITVANRGKRRQLEVVVIDNREEPNEWPIADAGEDLTVKSGEPVVLNGLNSFDPDGDPLRYEWAQIRGVTVPLLDPWTVRPSFVAPKVSGKRLFQFQLRVTDMAGADRVKGADSLSDLVNVWVIP